MVLEHLRLIGMRGCFVVLMLTALSALSACNTVSGLGEDVESAGDTLSDSAEDVQD